ncbi:hypothetical protein ACQKEN_03475 [Pseudomonas sp. NPDC078416]|uniref:hypothetical protein n=1 Tax=Pseudomonas sp. NPDC078416 TaxID=3390637 RepID=UPI003D069BEC
MVKLKIACALLTVIIALYSATLLIIVKINFAAAVVCVAIMAALIANLTSTHDSQNRREQDRANFFGM